MLLPRQWTRVAGGVLAGLVILFLLKTFFLPGSHQSIFHISSYSHAWSNDGQTLDQKHEEADSVAPIAPSEHQTDHQSSRTWPGKTYSTSKPSPATTVSISATILSTPAGHVADPSGSTKKPFVASGNPSHEPVTSVTSSIAETSTAPAASTPTALRKTIVMGKLSSEDTDWVQDDMEGWNHAVYLVDLAGNEHSPTGFKTKVNKAKEATPYLTYIVEHYDMLPDVAVFLHAHRKNWPEAWHNDAKGYDAVNMLHELKLDVVLERGYVNLRCVATPGCPDEVQLNRSPIEEDRHAEIAYPFVFGSFFNLTEAEVREQIPIVATPCCAQFAVSKAQILSRPKAEYARYLTLIEDSHYDDETLGTVMEYMWHIIFGRDAVFCEATEECWANIYGRQNGWNSWT